MPGVLSEGKPLSPSGQLLSASNLKIKCDL